MKKQNVRTISLIVCTFTYLLVGAAVFDALESDTEKRRWEALNAIESMIMRKYNISVEDFKVMETVVLKSEPHKAGQQWKFTGAFYYATTVLTTIGYGHSTPTTVGGKLFTMCYAIVGIPLGLVMFQSIGERVNRLSSFVIRTVKQSLSCSQTQASELDLICVVTTLSSLTIAGGAAAFSRFEGWSYFDSVYYCFITLTTIGFGDMVALQKDNALNKKPEYVMFALIFILFGLAIVAASLNLLVLRFVTMNTEDERRDEAQAMQALQVAVRLEGDVITANGSILSGHIGHDSASLGGGGDNTSICSCHCACFRASRHKSANRYKVHRSPSHIRQLLPHHTNPAASPPPIGLVMPLKEMSATDTGSAQQVNGNIRLQRYYQQNGGSTLPRRCGTPPPVQFAAADDDDNGFAYDGGYEAAGPMHPDELHHNNNNNNYNHMPGRYDDGHQLQLSETQLRRLERHLRDGGFPEADNCAHNLAPSDLPPLYQPLHRASF